MKESVNQKIYKKNPQKRKENKNWEKKEQNIQGLWDNYKRCNICVMGTTEERKEEKKYLK